MIVPYKVGEAEVEFDDKEVGFIRRLIQRNRLSFSMPADQVASEFAYPNWKATFQKLKSIQAFEQFESNEDGHGANSAILTWKLKSNVAKEIVKRYHDRCVSHIRIQLSVNTFEKEAGGIVLNRELLNDLETTKSICATIDQHYRKNWPSVRLDLRGSEHCFIGPILEQLPRWQIPEVTFVLDSFENINGIEQLRHFGSSIKKLRLFVFTGTLRFNQTAQSKFLEQLVVLVALESLEVDFDSTMETFFESVPFLKRTISNCHALERVVQRNSFSDSFQTSKAVDFKSIFQPVFGAINKSKCRYWDLDFSPPNLKFENALLETVKEASSKTSLGIDVKCSVEFTRRVLDVVASTNELGELTLYGVNADVIAAIAAAKPMHSVRSIKLHPDDTRGLRRQEAKSVDDGT